MKKALLVILDGFGHREEKAHNAIAGAATPFIDSLRANHASSLLHTSGLHVGLPDGQMGNSEVGHITIGSGRIVYQDSTRIDKSISDNIFAKNDTLLSAMNRAKRDGKTFHVLGLLSDGGVHSHQNHLYTLLEMAKENGLTDVSIHAFMDGRDTAPRSGRAFMAALEEKIAEIGIGRVASVSGRYFAMDRDKRWERVEKAYNAMTGTGGDRFASADAVFEHAYKNDITDEFIEPCIVGNGGAVENGDVMVFFNFRADRARQISRAFASEEFAEFSRTALAGEFVQFTEYDASFPLPTVFPKTELANTLGEVLAASGKSQLRCAETEKYAHVTFFFNGGDETVNEGEERILVASPKVPTYDLQPEMSAPEVTDKLLEAIAANTFDFIAVNYANPDMVGHTGNYNAAVAAIEAIDACLARLIPAAIAAGHEVIITADHGNSELMLNEETGEPFTQHTTGPVPVFFASANKNAKLRHGGSLQDIAPTVLDILNVDKPSEMTGESLLA